MLKDSYHVVKGVELQCSLGSIQYAVSIEIYIYYMALLAIARGGQTASLVRSDRLLEALIHSSSPLSSSIHKKGPEKMWLQIITNRPNWVENLLWRIFK
jgi:hypothetical protein